MKRFIFPPYQFRKEFIVLSHMLNNILSFNYKYMLLIVQVGQYL